MDQKYIFLDVDGTLFDPKTRRVPQSTLDALIKAKANGHKLFLCTGRSHSESLEVRGLGVEYDGFICSAGAVVEVGDTVIYESFIPASDIPPIAAFAEANNTGYVLEGTRSIFLDALGMQYFENLMLLDYNGDKTVDKAVVQEKMRLRKLFPLADYVPGRDHICKIVLIVKDPSLVAALEAILPPQFATTTVIGYDADFLSVEVNLRAVTKATGIQILLDHFGADWADTIGYGDSMNDVDMLKRCQIGVCMENGDERLKAVADDVTAACDDDGIWKSFKKYGLI